MKHPVVTKYLIQIGTLHYLSNITEGSNNSVGGDIFTQFNKSEGFLLSIMYFLIKCRQGINLSKLPHLYYIVQSR